MTQLICYSYTYPDESVSSYGGEGTCQSTVPPTEPRKVYPKRQRNKREEENISDISLIAAESEISKDNSNDMEIETLEECRSVTPKTGKKRGRPPKAKPNKEESVDYDFSVIAADGEISKDNSNDADAEISKDNSINVQNKILEESNSVTPKTGKKRGRPPKSKSKLDESVDISVIAADAEISTNNSSDAQNITLEECQSVTPKTGKKRGRPPKAKSNLEGLENGHSVTNNSSTAKSTDYSRKIGQRNSVVESINIEESHDADVSAEQFVQNKANESEKEKNVIKMTL